MTKATKPDSISASEHRYIIGSRVDATSYQNATQQIVKWAEARTCAYVCAANVHMLMEAYDNAEFADVVNCAALVTPDGMPLVWALAMLGVKRSSRVYGPTLTLQVCKAASQQSIPIGLYGGTSDSLAAFAAFLKQKFPSLQIACQIAPPFRSLTLKEDYDYTSEIRNSGARILLVGIGCPKQEIWMHRHQDQLQLVMLGVGAAFDFHSGRVKQAPALLQNIGLEWMFRLFMEPKRLWKRYFKHNPRFIIFFTLQWITSRLPSFLEPSYHRRK